ncbi:transposase, IS4 family protein [Sulfobacillus acidophilus TPY]|nr:transposase, IS4 family protein [Sulfobacillus acidophilus TPY]
MVRPIVIWEEGHEVLSSQGGLGIIGALVDQLPLGPRLNRTQIPENLRPDIGHRDVAMAYIGLLAQGKSDFDHIEAYRADPFFGFSLGIDHVPSSPTIRQRLDQAAAREGHPWVAWGPSFGKATSRYSKNTRISSRSPSARVPMFRWIVMSRPLITAKLGRKACRGPTRGPTDTPL